MLEIGASSSVVYLSTRAYVSCRDSFPSEHVLGLRDVLLDVAGRSAVTGKTVVALRKLFVAVNSFQSYFYITSILTKLCCVSFSRFLH